MFVPSEGHKHGDCEIITKRSVIEFCYWKEGFYSELWHIEINATSSASKYKSDNSSFDLRDSLFGPPFACHAMQKLGVLYYNKNSVMPEKSCPEIIYFICFNPQVLHLCGNSGLTFKESSPACFQMIPYLTIFTTAMPKYQGKVPYIATSSFETAQLVKLSTWCVVTVSCKYGTL